MICKTIWKGIINDTRYNQPELDIVIKFSKFIFSDHPYRPYTSENVDSIIIKFWSCVLLKSSFNNYPDLIYFRNKLLLNKIIVLIDSIRTYWGVH